VTWSDLIGRDEENAEAQTPFCGIYKEAMCSVVTQFVGENRKNLHERKYKKFYIAASNTPPLKVLT
jgi:hypothetical protein